MALKTVSTEVQSYIPKCERTSDKPFTVNFIQMNKRQFDEYTESLFETKKGKIVSKPDKSGSIFRRTLKADADTNILKNIMNPDGSIGNITNLETAIDFILSLPSDIGNEIELQLRGSSSLNEDEEKN